MEKKVRYGSSRVILPVYESGEIVTGIVDFEFRDDMWSVDDRGASEITIPGLAASRVACAVRSFELAHEVHAATHFIKQVNSRTIRVKEYSVESIHEDGTVEVLPPLSRIVSGRATSVEWIHRNFVEGKLWERIKEEEILASQLGFPSGYEIKKGDKLPELFQECSTKRETTDRYISTAEAKDIAKIGPIRMNMARKIIRRVEERIGQAYEKVGYWEKDGKWEFGINRFRKPVLIDVFGTPDENRIVNIESGENYDKDLLRNYLNATPWKKELDEAKRNHPKDKSMWPPYPEIPESIIELVSKRYRKVAEDYSGVSIDV